MYLRALHHHLTSSNIEENIPTETPDICVPTEPADLPALPPVPPHHLPQESIIPSHVSADNDNDQDFLNTCNYNNLVKAQYRSKVPAQVRTYDSVTDNTSSTESANATPFLSAASNKALPKYSAKHHDDINEFICKLRVLLNHSSNNNCHLHSSTTETKAEQSKNLAALLSMCLSGNALSPFMDNPAYDHNGIEMLNHLIDLKHPISKSLASTMYNALNTQCIKPDESFDASAKRLCI